MSHEQFLLDVSLMCCQVHFDCDALYADASRLVSVLLWHDGVLWAYISVKLSCHSCRACFGFVLLMAPRWVPGIRLC